MIEIRPILNHKKQYLDLLLLADEQESMIDRYLERGEMFVLSDKKEIRASCVVTCEGEGVYEIKNMAVYPEYQRQGYGKRLITFILEHYKDRCHTLLVGTGESPLTIPFYESCGFVYSHRIPDFFTDHYDHPIFEEGRQLKDMIYLKKRL
ncbi:MAG: GNAT family N-acetyltransferase [Bacteroides sp.]|nr:GNAT family N-acetyltransferase [Bacteroides sp.]